MTTITFRHCPEILEDIEGTIESNQVWVELFDSRHYIPINIDKTPNTEGLNLEVFEVYAYVHGSVKLSLTPFHCNWDAGVAGRIFIEQQIEGEAKVKRVEKVIKYLNDFLNNDAFEYYDEEGEIEEFNGNMEECMEYASKLGLEAEFVY